MKRRGFKEEEGGCKQTSCQHQRSFQIEKFRILDVRHGDGGGFVEI